EVVPLPRNRVELKINIYEGKPARIRDINIVGNTIYSDDEILKSFELRPSHFWSFIKGDDKYARESLSGDLEKLRSFYLHRGYISIALESAQVSVPPDPREVFITAKVVDGKRYKVGDVKQAGELVGDEEQLEP